MTDETQPEVKPSYKNGDEVTVSRGNKRGQVGTVIDVDTDKQEYALRLEAGGLAVVHFSSVKEKVEPTITESQLRELLAARGLNADSVLGDYFTS